MPGDKKKKVNLVNLKTKFGHFLNKHYSCSSCHSMDKLVFGFACEHRLCTNCNGNFTDQCKVCKAEIENTYQDALQNKLYPCLENLKDMMTIDLAKVANKLKLQQANAAQLAAKPAEEVAKKEIAKKAVVEMEQNEENQQPENESAAKDEDDARPKENPEETPNQDEDQNENNEAAPVADRSSKRQSKREKKTTEKANESKKNSSAASESKKNNSNVEQPVKSKSFKEPEIVAPVNESKSVRIRESSRSKEPKKLNDSVKGMFNVRCANQIVQSIRWLPDR